MQGAHEQESQARCGRSRMSQVAQAVQRFVDEQRRRRGRKAMDDEWDVRRKPPTEIEIEGETETKIEPEAEPPPQVGIAESTAASDEGEAGEGAGMAKKQSERGARKAARGTNVRKTASRNGAASKAAPKAPRTRGDLSAKLSGGNGGKTLFVSGTVAVMRAVLKTAIKGGELADDVRAAAQRMLDRIEAK